MKFWNHLRTVQKHRKQVRKLCFKLGLYHQGIFHDMSKYSPTEFFLGVKYYQGFQSPHNGERKEKGYADAWLHHKGRNKHHLEYWCDYDVYGTKSMMGVKMPTKYMLEMFCDRIGASKNYLGNKYTDSSPYEYYLLNKDHYLLHPKTRNDLEALLIMLRDNSEEKTFDFIRKNILGK